MVFQWIMTTRKVISVVFSLLWFGHAVTPKKLACIIVVFGLLFYQKLSGSSKKRVSYEDGAEPKAQMRRRLSLDPRNEASLSEDGWSSIRKKDSMLGIVFNPFRQQDRVFKDPRKEV